MSEVRKMREVRLLVAGGLAGGRPHALAIGHDDRDLGGPGMSDPFRHQGEPRSARRRHHPGPGVGGTDDHVHGRELVLGLTDHAMERG